MAGPPPPFAWSAEGGYQPPIIPPGIIYGVAPNPNIFYSDIDGPQSAVPVVSMAPPVVVVGASPPPAQVFVTGMPTHPPTFLHPWTGSSYQREASPGLGCRNWCPGITVLPPASTTHIHVYWSSESAWAEPHTVTAEDKVEFKTFAADCDWSINRFIEQLVKVRKVHVGHGSEKADGCAVTEWTEAGNGRFLKGSSFKYDDKKAKDTTLTAVGWTAKRGAQLPPVFVQLHKA